MMLHRIILLPALLLIAVAYRSAIASEVWVNDERLTDVQLEKLAVSIGARVQAGRYWYDEKTGAWGKHCGPGLGLVQPGLHIGGRLKADASCGQSGVFVNGRELHQQDVLLLQSLSGYIAPGRYWMDAQFNAGIEGGPALLNYKVLAAGRNQGRDNFWSTPYGAGNSNADNSQGYVNVPGHGPVGYGY